MAFGGNIVLKDPKLVEQTANLAIKLLQREVNHGRDIPMSQFAEILIWESNNLKRLENERREKLRREGWETKSVTWCGVPTPDFEIPELGIYAQRKKA